ncbi:MAG: twin-arginine translocase TatA/TatE family subunit [Bacteroidia bacterium]
MNLFSLLFLGGIGGWEVFLVVLLVVILFGAKRIPELARGMGKGIREFKDATRDVKNEIDKEVNDIKRLDQ